MATLATLRTDAYTTMYNHLQTGTYAISTDNIHPSYNDTHLAKEGYPQVAILEPRITKAILTKGLISNALKSAYVTFVIHVRHNTSASLKSLVDDVDNKISTGLSVFRAQGLRPVRNDNFISEEYGSTYSRPNQTIHYCDISIQFRYVGST